MATKTKVKILQRTEFGNPILREVATRLSEKQIKSHHVRQLIQDMLHTLSTLKLGVGLAAPQVGVGFALSVISIQPTPHRPKVEPFDLIIINPEINETIGRKKQLWEGCISGGAGKAGLFAKVPRYSEIKLTFLDETGTKRHEIFEGLPAQVIQHEIDHLNGILFVDRVTNTKTYTTHREYMRFNAKT